MKRHLSIALLAASTALLLAGCAEPATDPAPQDRNDAHEIIPYTGDDLSQMRSIEWVRSSTDGNEVRIEVPFDQDFYENPCYRYATRTQETADAVIIDLYWGRLPNTDGLCDQREGGLRQNHDRFTELPEDISGLEVSYGHVILVELEEPLGDRELVEGDWAPGEWKPERTR